MSIPNWRSNGVNTKNANDSTKREWRAMAMIRKRKFGEIPAWTIKAPVTRTNHDQKAEYHGVNVAKWNDNWPFVSNDEDYADTADRATWEDYFWKYLGGWPESYKLFRNGVMKSYNLPEASPELFDPRWKSR